MPSDLFDRLTWTRWRKAVSSFAGSPDAGRRANVLFAALLGLLLAINGLNVVNSYVGRDFMTAIEQRSMSGFLCHGVSCTSASSRRPRSQQSCATSPRKASRCFGATG